ncbi:hypothetical protein EZV62_005143 [Acer yangbiense]|uniref:Uncharacterized protein n=1 Tax=Acer yangbiense TaxID=1000413 RepID=A0A5C7IM64_9ROSI|nr:hypothetical protein EZV62_005143 [Acer yangbiense]
MFYIVKSCFSQGELQLIIGSMSFGSSEVLVERKENLGKDFKILDEVFKLVEQNVDLKAKTVAMEPPKEIIKSELFVHQKEGLGLFTDNMGLGKTLTFLSLIALDKCTTFKNYSVGRNSSYLNMVEEINEIDDGLISLSTNKRKKCRVSERGTRMRKQYKTEDTHVEGNLKGKLVEKHNVPGMLKTFMYYGNNTTTDFEEIRKYDVVLTTYSTLNMDSRS